MDSLCDELSIHEYEDIVEVDSFFDTVNVKGRLKDHIQFWVNIQAPEFILSVISEGYKLPLLHTPPRSFTKNNLSAINNSVFVTESILDLLALDRISEFSKDSLHVINPLSVSTQSSGKRRLILDLRFVDQFILKQKVKFEDYKTALDLFQYGGYACSFDLKSGYHHVDIFPSHQRFLGFSWTFPDGRTRYFAYTVLPFGLSLAPYLFTKLVRPLVKYWRSRGLYCIVYLDDGFIMDSTLEKTQRASHLVYGDLVASGFVLNQEKSIWCPVQSIVWLGIVWNFEHGTIANTDARIGKIEERLSLILQKKLVSTRELASVTGSVISLSPVFGNLSRIMSRHCQISIAASPGWDFVSELDSYCVAELQFWLSSIKKFNSKNCFQSLSHNQIVYSDASGFACGAIILNNNTQICHRPFTQEERAFSSTHRELIAIEYSLKAFGPILCNSKVKWFTDSQSSVRIVEVGSMQFSLHTLAITIFEFCIRNNIELSVQWIPRSLNQKADSVSKFMDIDDWQITSEFFAFLEQCWGPHTIDCFANFYNTKIERFFSRFWNPGTAGVDAFFQSWQNENCLLVPPVTLVCETLKHMDRDSAVGTLVIPDWPSSAFWPLLWGHYKNPIVVFSRHKGKNVVIHGRNVNSLFGSPNWEGHVYAIRLNFRKP